MSAPNPLYYMCPSLQDYFVDKDNGAPLSAGIVTFYRDENHSTLKSVYQQIRNPAPPFDYQFVALPNPMVLSSIGTFVDTNGADIIPYFYPWTNSPAIPATGDQDLYYIIVKSSGNIPQFTREAWPPNAADNPNTSETFDPTANVISNPQFIDVLFSGTTTLPVTGVGTITEIAPDWFIQTTGAGNVVVNQFPIINNPTASNPPFVLDITVPNLAGSLVLKQRLANSPRLFAGGYMSGYFIAASQDGISHNIDLYYQPSGISAAIICSVATSITGSYLEANNTIAANNVTLDPATTGYIDFYLAIPPNSHVRVTSIQVVGVANITSSLKFIQESSPRQRDHLYHYWEPSLKYMPISSYLTGWEFPHNPAQFLGSNIAALAVGANKSYYAWDQTIVFQSVNSAITISREFTIKMLRLTAAIDTGMAVVQYLSGPQAFEIMSQLVLGGVSVNIEMSSSIVQTLTVSLWWRNGAIGNGMTVNDSLVTSLDANGFPSVVAGWTEITRDSLGKATFQSTPINSVRNYGFSNFFDSLAYLTGTDFAIVVGSSTVGTGNHIEFRSISLVPGKIPTIPAPQTADQVLRECQYYYEHSYARLTTPIPALTTRNALVFPLHALQIGGGTFVKPSAFTIQYAQEKIALPVITLYPPSGVLTAGNIYAEAAYTGGPPAQIGNIIAANSWVQRPIGTKSVSYVPLNYTSIYAQGGTTGGWGFIEFHYTADARLGTIL